MLFLNYLRYEFGQTGTTAEKNGQKAGLASLLKVVRVFKGETKSTPETPRKYRKVPSKHEMPVLGIFFGILGVLFRGSRISAWEVFCLCRIAEHSYFRWSVVGFSFVFNSLGVLLKSLEFLNSLATGLFAEKTPCPKDPSFRTENIFCNLGLLKRGIHKRGIHAYHSNRHVYQTKLPRICSRQR